MRQLTPHNYGSRSDHEATYEREVARVMMMNYT